MIRRALIYFGCVFALGFVLGAVRVTCAVPLLGERAAELLETPLMLAGIFFIARWLVRRCPAERHLSHLGSGILALVMMVAIELTVVLWLRGLSFADYLATRDPVSGSAYVVALLLFALMPWAVAGSGRRGGSLAGS